jgi:ADP-heptose:LPS heptosyltransferase
MSRYSSRALVVRLDSLGDMLVCGPSVRAVAAHADRVTVLAGPRGAEAARLLPGVDDVIVWDCPWITYPPPATNGDEIAALAAQLRRADIDSALILTSFHQSALPTALLLRLAGIPRIAAASEDYPGALLDLRVSAPPEDEPEAVRMLAIARDAGYALPIGDDGLLAIRRPEVPVTGPTADVVVHPGTDAPARAYPEQLWADVVELLADAGYSVAVTGSSAERPLTRRVSSAATQPGFAEDCGGSTDLAQLAALVARAGVVICGNTGPAHLAAAVGTPVVSLFAPVVPASRWAPYGVPTIVLGDQTAPCRGTRARICPIAGHPCLTKVSPTEVVEAAAMLLERAAVVA